MKPVRRMVAVALLFGFLTTGGAGQGTAYAHELKQDNGVSAVLHIAPDDNPRSGQATLLYFAFSSRRAGFDLAYCKCQVSFQSSDNRLAIEPIVAEPASARNGYATVKFDKPGVYNLAVRGQTATGPADRFNFSFQLRVVAGTSAAETAARTAASWQVIVLGATSLAIMGVVASAMIRRGRRYTL